MSTGCSAVALEFTGLNGRSVVAAFDGGAITSDAGALLLGETDRSIGLVERFAACFKDRRRPALIEHEIGTLVMQRVFGIALGYEDLIDHDHLRHDPVMAVLAGKLEATRAGCAPLAGKSTLNRLELSRATPSRYHKISHDAPALENLFVDLFLEAHGNYCYIPLYMFCGRHLLAAKLRRSNIDAAAGSVEQTAPIVAFGFCRKRFARM